MNSARKSRKYYQNFDKIVCVSQEVLKAFQKIFGTNYKTIVKNNVIDDEEILKKAEEKINWDCRNSEKRLLAVGRLARQKNFEYLIDSCAKVRNAGYLFQLIILGEGPERQKIEYQIKKLNIGDCIKLYGFCQNPYPFMKKADAIICSSIYEGLSTVVQEALILGKPVVTTPCGGMNELLGKSEYGIIAENTEEGLYKALIKLFSSETMFTQYGCRALIRGKFYKKSRTLKETEQMFGNLLHEKVLEEINAGKYD